MNRIVVARWQEDTSWTRLARWPTYVVQKGQQMPNEGREPASFLWYILNKGIRPDDTYAFVQGDPFAHGVTMTDFREVDEYTPLGTWEVECDDQGAPHHPGLPMQQKWDDWIGGPRPDAYKFVAGGQFLVPGHVIHQHPKAKYRYLLDEMSIGSNPWVMERLFPYLWSTGRA